MLIAFLIIKIEKYILKVESYQENKTVS